MELTSDFFNRDTVQVAKDLIGKVLVRKIKGKEVWAIITETEAYCGQKDKTCHSAKGRTNRTEVMFGPPGGIYIYLIYGLYYCMNFVTKPEGCPEAVLIRGVYIIDPKQDFKDKDISKLNIKEKVSGPGRLTRSLEIDKKLNGKNVCEGGEVRILDLGIKSKIKKSPRIGIDYAGSPWKEKLWRFYI